MKELVGEEMNQNYRSIISWSIGGNAFEDVRESIFAAITGAVDESICEVVWDVLEEELHAYGN